jgi:RNA recognition motif-containing protein
MIKKLILSILFPAIVIASNLKINDKIGNFSLTDQFDKIHTINSGVSTIIVTFQRDTLELINDFLSAKNENFLEDKHAVFINNITSSPNIIRKMFTIPHLRDYKYTILLVYDQNSIKFLKEENKVTIYSIFNGQVSNIQYLSSKDELEKFFN